MNQNQVRLLVAGILILAVAAIVIFFQKDIASLISSKNDTIQRQENSTTVKPVILDTSEPDLEKGNTEAISELPEYELIINNRKELVDLLFSWGVYNRTYDLDDNGKNSGGVNKVIFKVVKKPQKASILGISRYSDQSSVDIYAVDNTLEVEIYFSNTAFPGVKGYISDQALFGLYLMSHPFPASESRSAIEGKFDIVRSELEKDVTLFNIAKKPKVNK